VEIISEVVSVVNFGLNSLKYFYGKNRRVLKNRAVKLVQFVIHGQGIHFRFVQVGLILPETLTGIDFNAAIIVACG
jgi:hypothetical protein